MATENSTITVKQGDTYSLRIYAKDCLGTALDLTNYSARGQVRERYSSTGILLTLNPTVHASYVSGIVDLSIPSSGTAALPISQFVWDIEVYTTNDAVVYKVANGYLNVLPETTR